jgi:hypothetical protein
MRKDGRTDGRTDRQTKIKQIIASGFAEGLKGHKSWKPEFLPPSGERLGRHRFSCPVQCVQWWETAVHVSRKRISASLPFLLRTWSHSLSQTLCSFSNRKRWTESLTQTMRSFKYCLHNHAELTDISAVYLMPTFSAWNLYSLRKRNVGSRRRVVNIGLTVENRHLLSRTTIYKI